MSSRFDFSDYNERDLKDCIRYQENRPDITTMGPMACGCEGWSRGGRVCVSCCMRELCNRWGYDWDNLKHDIKTLAQLERYKDLAEKGTAHSMCIMLASHVGPAGFVRGSKTPCPKTKS